MTPAMRSARLGLLAGPRRCRRAGPADSPRAAVTSPQPSRRPWPPAMTRSARSPSTAIGPRPSSPPTRPAQRPLHARPRRTGEPPLGRRDHRPARRRRRGPSSTLEVSADSTTFRSRPGSPAGRPGAGRPKPSARSRRRPPTGPRPGPRRHGPIRRGRTAESRPQAGPSRCVSFPVPRKSF